MGELRLEVESMATAAQVYQFSFLSDLREEASFEPPDAILSEEILRPRLVEPPPLPNQREEVARLRRSLEARVAARISSGSELILALEKNDRHALVPTTIEPFDRLLEGGLVRGRMTELAGRRSSGRFSLVHAVLTSTTSMGEAAALVDVGDHFDPQLAAAAGVDLRRLLWVRPPTMKEAAAAAEMLMSAGFQLVVLDAGMHPLPGRRVADAAWVRLGRAAAAHGTILVVATPYPLTGTASEAVVLTRNGRPSWQGRGLTPRLLGGTVSTLLLEKHRHIRPGRSTAASFRMIGAVGRSSPPMTAAGSEGMGLRHRPSVPLERNAAATPAVASRRAV
jgi:hypothetical protein